MSSAAARRLPRVDGPRRLRRRPAAGRARRGRRRRARRHRAARRRAARDGPGRARPDRGRAVLPVLRHRPADDRVGRARAPARAQPAHAPRGDGRGGGVLPELYGCTPVEYLDSLGWLDGDVWCAHCVHLSDAEIARFAETGTGVAHCPTSNLRLGAGVAPVRRWRRGVRVGLGVDGSASNERSHLFNEVKQALLVARGRGGPTAMTAREAIRLGTRAARRCSPRRHRRDRARMLRRPRGLGDGRARARGRRRPGRGLVFAGAHRVDRLYVGGELVVRGGALVRADESGDRSRPPAQRVDSPNDDCGDLDARARRRGPRRRAGRPLPRRHVHGETRTDTDGRAHLGRPRPRHVPARLPSTPRRSSGASSSRSIWTTATTTSRCSSPRTRARATAAAERRGADAAVLGPNAARRRARGAPDPLAVAEEVALALPEADQVAALATHPRIGEPSEEQRGAEPEVLEELARLNEEYERRFGFEFVVFVDGARAPSCCRSARAARAAAVGGARDRDPRLCAIARDRWTRTT